MRKTFLIALFGVGLVLTGCIQRTPSENQNLNQSEVNQGLNINQTTTEQNQNINTNQPIINVNQDVTQTTNNLNTDIAKITESFISSRSCSGISCRENEFPFCFLGERCVKPNEDFREWVEKNYVTFTDKALCNNITCDKCERGKLIGLQTVYYNFEIKLCHECDINGQGRGFGCISGYQCELGKCIKK